MEAVTERSALMEWIRGEIIGPRRYLQPPRIIGPDDEDVLNWKGPVAWVQQSVSQEVLYAFNETPLIKYGAGILHPRLTVGDTEESIDFDDVQTDEFTDDEISDVVERLDIDQESVDSDHPEGNAESAYADGIVDDDDHEVVAKEYKLQSSMAISVCVSNDPDAVLVFRMPERRRYQWQEAGSVPFELNGCYRRKLVSIERTQGRKQKIDVWYRTSATSQESVVQFSVAELVHNQAITRKIPCLISSLDISATIMPRRSPTGDSWIITAVLTNESERKPSEIVTTQLFQSFFELQVQNGSFHPYPSYLGLTNTIDDDELSLELLYRDNPQWAIGHGCSASWDCIAGEVPPIIYAEVMPATELPSMTPDVMLNGKPLKISMYDLAELSDDGTGKAWQSLDELLRGYHDWIESRETDVNSLDSRFRPIATQHLVACRDSLDRMQRGLALLRQNERVRDAFRLANRSMLLQQIASKQLHRRKIDLEKSKTKAHFDTPYSSPKHIMLAGSISPGVGSWRAFQIAFFLLSLPGVTDHSPEEREIVDLIWFPTGGGKTEAYLAVVSCYLWYQRMLGRDEVSDLTRDGTGVIMRYTLRMLTTQQFQRAASLICAMEVLRKDDGAEHGLEGNSRPFSLGLWIGQAGSPNTCEQARTELNQYINQPKSKAVKKLNPLVLLECPWCRAEIGVVQSKTVRGIVNDKNLGPYLKCSDPDCHYGKEFVALPVEVIDERIYRNRPSFLISTVDKFAMAAYRPGNDKRTEVASLFGREFRNGKAVQVCVPPGLIIQDELHLISGPIGTMYALYESVIEELCTLQNGDDSIRPKIIASTATIRGAQQQVKVLYNRDKTSLFPSPGLQMGDSFFGQYAQDHNTGSLARGRMYLGISTPDYKSSIKLQVESLSAPLYRTWLMKPESRDPWWTLLSYYNSLREIGIGQTLFSSQIRGRLNYLRLRDGLDYDARRRLTDVRELSSRLTQSGLIDAMDVLAMPYQPDNSKPGVDVCLTSNIIEVGVDIDRLSLMAVVGQPRSTASYIQITGRVGRKWYERPGLIMMLYNHNRRRDVSHYEHFQSYHHRLYEQVEPTSATPYSRSALERGLLGVLILRVRMELSKDVDQHEIYMQALERVLEPICNRLLEISGAHHDDVESNVYRLVDTLKEKWGKRPASWEKYPPVADERYLMLWPGQQYSPMQRNIGTPVGTSMRHVDSTSRLKTREDYI